MDYVLKIFRASAGAALTACAWSLWFGANAVGQANQVTVTGPNGLQAEFAVDSDYRQKWAFVLLPAGYEPLSVSKNGVVFLKKDLMLYRWHAGTLAALGYDSYRRAFNDIGSIAVGYAGVASQPQVPPFEVGYTVGFTTPLFHVKKDILVWSLARAEPYAIEAAKTFYYTAVKASLADLYRPYDPAGYIYWVAQNQVSAVNLNAIDNRDRVWFDEVTKVTNGTVVSSQLGGGQDFVLKRPPSYELKNFVATLDGSRVETGGAVLPAMLSGSFYASLFSFYAPSSIYSLVAGDGVKAELRSAARLGAMGRPEHYLLGAFVGDRLLGHLPFFINAHGAMLGRQNGSVVFEDAAGVVRPAPSEDGYTAFWIDDADRPNGTMLGRGVTWATEYSAQGAATYVPRYYYQLKAPEGWKTDHQVPHDATRPQLGLVNSIATGEVRPFLAVPALLSVDANRDGAVSADSSDLTSASRPFRFWLNDDIDRKGVDPDEADVEDDDDPSGHSSDRDWMVNQIPCKRDLEDFARLWVYMQGLNTAFQNGDMKLGLKWTNITSGTPAIKLYRAADTDGGTGYLFDPTIAQTQIDPAGAGKAIAMTPEGGGAAITVIEGANGFIFPKEAFANLTDAQSKTYLLFEGCKKGAGQLQLVIYDKNGTKVGDGPGIYLDLKNIKEMYERWTVGDGPNPLIGQKGGGDPATTAAISTARLPSDVAAFQYGPQQTPDDKNYILFVHGWNMPPWLKDAWAETTFKRLYWQGYKGRFGAFQWPTTYHDWSVVSVFDYDPGEHTAWRSAQPLAELLENFNVNRSYTVSVLAHSMGNIVTGEALQVAGRLNRIGSVANYVAAQAAAPGHTFDGSLSGGDLLSFGFLGFGNPSTPNIYRDWFYLSGLVARAQANFYNVNDYALSAPVWQTGQKLKPDSVAGVWTGTVPNRIGPPYGYSGDPAAAPVKAGFFKTARGPDINGNEVVVGTASLSLEDVDANNGSVTNLRDRYEIMAFASQPRSKALGGVTTVAGFSPQSLQSLWPADTFPQTNGPYSAHPWHSAQFRFTNADQANYWNKFMKKLGLPTIQ